MRSSTLLSSSVRSVRDTLLCDTLVSATLVRSTLVGAKGALLNHALLNHALLKCALCKPALRKSAHRKPVVLFLSFCPNVKRVLRSSFSLVSLFFAGSNGQDYPSRCHLERAACEHRLLDLSVRYEGKCNPCQGFECQSPQQECQVTVPEEDHARRISICTCDHDCANETAPICASNGKTVSIYFAKPGIDDPGSNPTQSSPVQLEPRVIESNYLKKRRFQNWSSMASFSK